MADRRRAAGAAAGAARELRRAGRPPLPHLLANGLVIVLATVAGFALSPA